MAALLPLLLPLLAPIVNAQAYDASVRNEDAFSYVQPLNTTILGAYGHSPSVMPSRTLTLSTPLAAHGTVILTLLQLMRLVSAGKKLTSGPRLSWLS
jgi:hypothetical protein